MAKASPGDYERFWNDRIDQLRRLAEQAYEHGTSERMAVRDIEKIGARRPNAWKGRIVLTSSGVRHPGLGVYGGLGKAVINSGILRPFGDTEFAFVMDNDLTLHVQRLGEPTATRATPSLAPPFSRIFIDRDEAEWAFGFLKYTLQGLGVSGPDDESFAVTLRYRDRALRLNYGNWAFLQFFAPGYRKYRCGISLIDALAPQMDEYDTWSPFNTDDDTTVVRVYEMPLERVRQMDAALRQAYDRTLSYTAGRFRHWSRSNLLRYNIPAIAEAVFDPQKLSTLLTQGLAQFEGEDADDDEEEEVGQSLDGCFTNQTFELLQALHANPRTDFYVDHREAFEHALIGPFKQLVHDVAAQLPEKITARLETESRVFARIPKNDYGQGGAWDFYWAAFYPKGSKRTVDAQLSTWINRDMLKLGFYIGAYGSEPRERFARNCKTHYETLVRMLGDTLADGPWVFGSRDEITLSKDSVPQGLKMTWQDWLRDPASADNSLELVLSRSQVLRQSKADLVGLAVTTFRRLFPLILLATEDDPIPVIADYLELEAIDETREARPPYPLPQCAADTGLDEALLARWVRAIHAKGQAILYGPPGTGKTFVAEKLAQHLAGGGDGEVRLVQFHPAYAYEDFIQGIRPKPRADGALTYELVPGRFLEFCAAARERQGISVMIVDEINRANLARVFGELMYLLEYRQAEVPLAAGGRFSIPENVRILGTMNTADRSIALVDHALRRRFAFLALAPNYEVLRHYHLQHATGFPVEPLIAVLKEINLRIGDPNYHLGITFFLHADLRARIEDIWTMEIVPYLEEYFFDQADQVEACQWGKVGPRILGGA